MKMIIERLIAPDAPGAVWGMTQHGPALVLSCDGYKVIAIFDEADALRDLCCHGLFVDGTARVAAHEAEHGAGVPVGVSSRLVDARGLPMMVDR